MIIGLRINNETPTKAKCKRADSGKMKVKTLNIHDNGLIRWYTEMPASI